MLFESGLIFLGSIKIIWLCFQLFLYIYCTIKIFYRGGA